MEDKDLERKINAARDATKIVLFGDSYTHGRLPHSQTDGALPNELGLENNYCFAKSGTTAQQWAINKDGMLETVIIVTLDLSTVLNSSHFDNVDIHPNVDGYKVMAKAINEAVSKLKEGEIK